MEDFQKRVVTEKVELDKKIVDLTSFVFSTKPYAFGTDEDQMQLLRTQLNIMQEYSCVLEMRIVEFN